LRLAVWSGPRNISTAMMRSWENREDCAVVDEPFYAHYLLETKLAHPGRDEVIVAGEVDWRKVAQQLVGPVPKGRAIYYQKHMTHHMLPHIRRDFFDRLSHSFLIRDPREVLASYMKSRPDAEVSIDDLGIPQQTALYDEVVQRTGKAPPVIDAGEFLRAPEAHLRAWCALLGIAFTPRMLHWPAGPRDTDGVWARHWYAAVQKSTGFEPAHDQEHPVPQRYAELIDAAMPQYQRLYELRLRP
jgi:hypothetical protein